MDTAIQSIWRSLQYVGDGDLSVNTQGLQELRQLVVSKGSMALQACHTQTPPLESLLLRFWDDARLIQHIINIPPQRQTSTIQQHLLVSYNAILAVEDDHSPIVSLQHALVQDVASHRIKAIYHHLSSNSNTAKDALRLLAACARTSSDAACKLVDGFDFNLKALMVLGRSPRSTDSQPPNTTRPLVVAWLLLLLQHADDARITKLLRMRPVRRLLLSSLATDPPYLARAIVQRVWWHLHTSAGGGVAQGPWDDTCLQQMVQVLSRTPTPTPIPSDNAQDDTTALINLCRDVLTHVCTTPHTNTPHTTTPHTTTLYPNNRTHRWQDAWRRAVRVVQQLKLSNPHHLALFDAVTSTSAALAAALLMQGWTPHPLETPTPSMPWLSAMHTIATLVQRAAGFVVEHARAVVGMPSGSAAGGAARRVLDLLLFPPAVASKAWYSRCLLHQSTLVRHTTLMLLQHLLETWQRVATALDDIKDMRNTRGKSSSAAGVHTSAAGVHTGAAGVHTSAAGVHTSAAGVHTSAAGVHTSAAAEGLCVSAGLALKRRLPEVQTIVAAHALSATGGGGTAAAASMDAEHPHQDSTTPPTSKATPGVLLICQLLRVLRLLCVLFPDKEVLTVNATKLLPMSVLQCPPLVQICWLEWQQSVLLPITTPTHTSKSTTANTTNTSAAPATRTTMTSNHRHQIQRPPATREATMRSCALFLHTPGALLELLQLASGVGGEEEKHTGGVAGEEENHTGGEGVVEEKHTTQQQQYRKTVGGFVHEGGETHLGTHHQSSTSRGGGDVVRRMARGLVVDVLEGCGLFDTAPVELQLWVEVVCGGHVRHMARSFFAEAVSSTLRKPFDAWQILQGVEQQAVQGVGQPQLVQHRGGVSLVALTALRQTVAFVGSAKQAAGDKIAVAETVASVLRGVLYAAGIHAPRIAAALHAAQPAPEHHHSSKKKKHPRGDTGGKAQELPQEASALAAVLQLVEGLCDDELMHGSSNGMRKRAKKEKSGARIRTVLLGEQPRLQGNSFVVSAINAAFTLQQGADQSGVQKLTAQLQAARDVLPALAVMLWLLPGMQHKVAAAWLDSVHAIMHVHVRRAPTAASSMLALVASHSVVQEVLSHCEESPALFGLADLLSMLAKQTETSHGTMPANTTALLHMLPMGLMEAKSTAAWVAWKLRNMGAEPDMVLACMEAALTEPTLRRIAIDLASTVLLTQQADPTVETKLVTQLGTMLSSDDADQAGMALADVMTQNAASQALLGHIDCGRWVQECMKRLSDGTSRLLACMVSWSAPARDAFLVKLPGLTSAESIVWIMPALVTVSSDMLAATPERAMWATKCSKTLLRCLQKGPPGHWSAAQRAILYAHAAIVLRKCTTDGKDALDIAITLMGMEDVWDMQHRERSLCVMQTIALMIASDQDMTDNTYLSALSAFAVKFIHGTSEMLRKSLDKAQPMLGLLDEHIGECLASLPDEARSSGQFVQIAQATLNLLKVGLKHHASDACVLRAIRRTLAALPPSNTYEGPSVAELVKLMEDVVLWVQRVVMHSRFDEILQHRSLPTTHVPWSSPLNDLVTTVMPLVGSEADVEAAAALSSDPGDELKGEWLTILELLLDFLGMYRPCIGPNTLDEVNQAMQRIAPALLDAYSGTLSRGDRATISLLLNIDMQAHSGCEQEAPLDHEFGVSCMMHGFLAKHGFGDVSVSQRCAALTIANFPDERQLLGNPDKVVYVEGLADPAFLLLRAAWRLRHANATIEYFMSSFDIPLALRALASSDTEIRLISDATDMRGHTLYVALLLLVQNSVPSPLYRCPRTMALFLAEAFITLSDPAGPLYAPINKYLWRAPVLHMQDVPLIGQWMDADKDFTSHSAWNWIQAALTVYLQRRHIRITPRIEDALAFLHACANNQLTSNDLLDKRASLFIKHLM